MVSHFFLLLPLDFLCPSWREGGGGRGFLFSELDLLFVCPGVWPRSRRYACWQPTTNIRLLTTHQCNQGQPCSNCARRFPPPMCEYMTNAHRFALPSHLFLSQISPRRLHLTPAILTPAAEQTQPYRRMPSVDPAAESSAARLPRRRPRPRRRRLATPPVRKPVGPPPPRAATHVAVHRLATVCRNAHAHQSNRMGKPLAGTLDRIVRTGHEPPFFPAGRSIHY